MRKLCGIVLLAALLLLPEGIYAERPGIISFIVDDFQYADGGGSTLEIRKSAIRIHTTGLDGEGEISCNNENCIDAGFDTKTLNIQQVLQMEFGNIDRTAGTMTGLRGRTMGTVSVVEEGGSEETAVPFKGRVKGWATWDDVGDSVVFIDCVMNVSASTKRGGTVDLQLHGELVRDGDTVEWTYLEASVAIEYEPVE